MPSPISLESQNYFKMLIILGPKLPNVVSRRDIYVCIILFVMLEKKDGEKAIKYQDVILIFPIS